MPRSKRPNIFVIFAGPEQHSGPGTRYYTQDATVTDIKTKAKKFYSFEDAKEFAEENNIELTHTQYIGLEIFSESELSRD